jgi:hypothetical protein
MSRGHTGDRGGSSGRLAVGQLCEQPTAKALLP